MAEVIVIVRLTDGEVVRYFFTERLRMGGYDGSDLVIENIGISRLRTLITVRGDHVLVQDLASQSGVLLQEKRVSELPVCRSAPTSLGADRTLESELPATETEYSDRA